MEKDSNKFQFKYPLNNQLFAEDGSGDGNGGGNGDDGNPEVKTVSKELYDKTASELAKVKKELSKFRTDDQNREIEFQETKDQLEALRIQVRKGDMIAGLSKLNLEEKLLNEIVDSVLDGDTSKIVNSISNAFKKTMEAKDKEIQTLKLEATKRPSADGGTGDNGEITLDSLKGKSIDEMQKILNEHPELKTQF